MPTGAHDYNADCLCASCQRTYARRALYPVWWASFIGFALLAVLVFTLGGCTTYTPSRPPPVPGPSQPPVPGQALDVQVADVDGPPLPGAVVKIQDGPNAGKTATANQLGRALFTGLTVPSGQTLCANKEGYSESCVGFTLTVSSNVTIRLAKARPATPPPGAIVARRGQTRATVHALLDDDGPRLYWGTSLFWALWGELHDIPKLDANLKTASESGADYIRVFAQVGGESWADRAVDPREPGWQNAIRSLTDKAYDTYGLRVQWTLFAWPKNLTQAQRMAAVESFLAAIDGRKNKVLAVECSNEGDGNGPSPADARALASRIRTSFPGLLAITAPNGDSCAKQAPWYANSPASLVTLHFGRSITGTGGRWRPVRQPWRESTFSCSGQAKAYSSNEPIGPKSSVAEDDDPLRLVMAAVVGWTGGVGAYVYHTDAGIRGGGFADRARGRRANLSEVSKWAETTRGLQMARSLLPADLPNWSRGSSMPPMFTVATFDGPSAAGRASIDRLYCAWKASEFVCAGINISKTTTLTAKRPMNVKVLHPLTGVVLTDVTLATGGTVALAGVPGGTGVILRGVFR